MSPRHGYCVRVTYIKLYYNIFHRHADVVDTEVVKYEAGGFQFRLNRSENVAKRVLFGSHI